jgi:nitronate monooxygenase
MVLDELEVPIVLAPLAGGPSTPELAAAVSNSGGLGFLGAGYLTADTLAERIQATRALTDRPIAVNLFVIDGEPADPATYADFVAALGPEAGGPRFDDDEFEAKVDVLVANPVAVVSFTFGIPPADAITRLREVGSEIWMTATSTDEAVHAEVASADVLVLQGAEAGGHRGSLVDDDTPPTPIVDLVEAVRAISELPIVAAGGIATAEHAQRVFDAGANAAAAGTAFMLAPEAGTSEVHRAAIASPTPTALTRAFTGRCARGIRNGFMLEHPSAPSAYPEIHYATAPIRAAARKAGDADHVNLWAGVRHALAVARPAAETVRALAPAR